MTRRRSLFCGPPKLLQPPREPRQRRGVRVVSAGLTISWPFTSHFTWFCIATGLRVATQLEYACLFRRYYFSPKQTSPWDCWWRQWSGCKKTISADPLVAQNPTSRIKLVLILVKPSTVASLSPVVISQPHTTRSSLERALLVNERESSVRYVGRLVSSVQV